MRARSIRRNVHRRRLGNANAGVEVNVVLCAGGAVTLAGIFIAQAGKLVAPANAITIARLGCCLDRDQRHSRQIVRFPRARCKRGSGEWRVTSGEWRARSTSDWAAGKSAGLQRRRPELSGAQGKRAPFPHPEGRHGEGNGGINPPLHRQGRTRQLRVNKPFPHPEERHGEERGGINPPLHRQRRTHQQGRTKGRMAG